METPLDPVVADLVKALDESQREEWEERAGIMEYDGKLPRAHAECMALIYLLRRKPDLAVRLFCNLI